MVYDSTLAAITYDIRSPLLLNGNNVSVNPIKFKNFAYLFDCTKPGRVAQSVARLTPEPKAPGSIPGPATYFRFSFR